MQISKDEDGYPTVEHIGSLTGHSKTVNCVRVSPNGKYIVSGGDGGELYLWAPDAGLSSGQQGNLICEEEARAGWRRQTVLRGHTDDVMDIAWAPDGSALLSGSIDNKGMVWEISEKKTGSMVSHFANHKHFVQGVAWDPHQQFIVTQSADRTCKIYALRPPAASKKKVQKKRKTLSCVLAKEFYCSHTISKRVVASRSEDAQPQRHALFHDESMPSFFRRPSWSPDGSCLIIPAGIFKAEVQAAEQNTAYLYARGKWTAPVAYVPAQSKPVVSARFCPVLFQRDTSDDRSPKPFEILPYKMVYAVATTDSVMLYDTVTSLPIAAFCQIHFDSITDIAWSKEGSYLAISSRDCFCSIISFEKGELGVEIDPNTLPRHIQAALQATIEVPGQDDKEDSIGKENSCKREESLAGQHESPVIEVTAKRKRITATPISTADKITTVDLTNSVAPFPTLQPPQLKTSKEKRRITPVAIVSNPGEGATAGPSIANIASLAAAAGQNEADASGL